jgi:hypothetical protein
MVDGASPGPPRGIPDDVSIGRLYILRSVYLLLVAGGFLVVPAALIDPEPPVRGTFPSMLAGLWLCAFVGLRYPLQMLPILLFELASKIIWMVVYGVPQFATGITTQQTRDLLQIAAGPLLLAAVIPWTYVYRHYVKQPAARWR